MATAKKKGGKSKAPKAEVPAKSENLSSGVKPVKAAKLTKPAKTVLVDKKAAKSGGKVPLKAAVTPLAAKPISKAAAKVVAKAIAKAAAKAAAAAAKSAAKATPAKAVAVKPAVKPVAKPAAKATPAKAVAKPAA
jgi:hypothetical protein